MSNIERIFVIGHPGAGKGLFAQSIAKALGWGFVNADLELEHRVGMPLESIIGNVGAKEYHNTQITILNNLQDRKRLVVATDGPAMGDSRVIELFQKESDFIVYLETSVETQLERSQRNSSELLIGSMKALFEQLHQLRDDTYSKVSHFIIDGNHSDISYQVKQVIDEVSIQKVNGELVLTEKELTLFHNKTHEAVNISIQQAKCLKYLVQGLAAKESAREMNISHRTVEAHLTELKRKLGCDTEKELIALYHNVI